MGGDVHDFVLVKVPVEVMVYAESQDMAVLIFVRCAIMAVGIHVASLHLPHFA